jgi:hypothetical protein
MRISRSKVDLFPECPRCFWLDQKAKIKRPPGPPFSLNIAVDQLLKNEFDQYRGVGVPPRLKEAGLEFIPAGHNKLELWRNNFKGVTRMYGTCGIEFFGAIDDLWVDSNGVHYVVDYKATSKEAEVNLDADWQNSYKRQAEFYQWLLRGNNLRVSNQAWFVYANGIKDGRAFNDTLSFKTKLISYAGQCLTSSEPPRAGNDCEFCGYTEKISSRYHLTFGA